MTDKQQTMFKKVVDEIERVLNTQEKLKPHTHPYTILGVLQTHVGRIETKLQIPALVPLMDMGAELLSLLIDTMAIMVNADDEQPEVAAQTTDPIPSSSIN